MRAVIASQRYYVDPDCDLDRGGRVWQAIEIDRDRNGDISLVLDTDMYELRLHCYTLEDGQWAVFSQRGDDLEIIDPNIKEFLAEIRRAIPGRS